MIIWCLIWYARRDKLLLKRNIWCPASWISKEIIPNPRLCFVQMLFDVCPVLSPLKPASQCPGWRSMWQFLFISDLTLWTNTKCSSRHDLIMLTPLTSSRRPSYKTKSKVSLSPQFYPRKYHRHKETKKGLRVEVKMGKIISCKCPRWHQNDKVESWSLLSCLMLVWTVIVISSYIVLITISKSSNKFWPLSNVFSG